MIWTTNPHNISWFDGKAQLVFPYYVDAIVWGRNRSGLLAANEQIPKNWIVA